MNNKIVKRIIKHVILLSVLVFALSSCEDGEPAQGSAFLGEDELSIRDYMISPETADSFSIFTEIIKTGKIFNTLSAFNPKGTGYTLFLPTNEAVEAFVANSKQFSSVEQLLADSSFCAALCRYHVVVSEVERKDFSFGALSDTTASGDFLTVGFKSANGGINNIVAINNTANVLRFDQDASNGVIHLIETMLEPNVYTSYEWLKAREGFSIFTEALEMTGLSDTINSLYRLNDTGTDFVKNLFTLLVEPDSVFNKRGIYSYTDLYDRYHTSGSVTDPENGLYQFVAYHIVSSNFYLNDLTEEAVSYNTYSILPLSVVSDPSYGDFSIPGVKVNRGIEPIDTIVVEGDSVSLSYVPVMLEESNQTSKNGAIHFISELLELRLIGAITKTIRIRDLDPLFNEYWNKYGASSKSYFEDFEDPEEFEDVTWRGVNTMTYVIDRELNWFDEYVYLNGFFEFEFMTPRVLPGTYRLVIYVHRQNTLTYGKKAVIQGYMDDIPMGGPIDLGDQTVAGARWTMLTDIELDSYEEHKITLKSQIGGSMLFYRIQFVKK